MADDDDHDDKTNSSKLKAREEFLSWKRKMALFALGKGDTDGIFKDLGNNPAVGYQAYGGGAQGNRERREWMKLAMQLVGKVGSQIENAALQDVWITEKMRIEENPANQGELPYIFAKCMLALEQDCARASEIANSIARQQFELACKSFIDKKFNPRNRNAEGGNSEDNKTGFVAYVDGIRSAERKLNSYGVDMTDGTVVSRRRCAPRRARRRRAHRRHAYARRRAHPVT